MKYSITVILWFLPLLLTNELYAMDTKALYAILVDNNTNTVLLEKNADAPMAPSSMSKLMTVYLVFEQLKNNLISLEDQFTVSERAWRKQGSKMFLKLDSKVSVKELLLGTVVQSGNDACIALAEGVMGSELAFTEAMNKKAQEFGMKNTFFKNASGWPEEGHIMSVRDLYILSKRLIEDFPEYYDYFAIKDYTFNGIKQENRNSLLARNIGVDGLKTGHADDAGYGVAVSSLINGRRLILVINGMDSMQSRAIEAESLLNYGFLNFTNVTAAKANQPIEKIEVLLGKSKTLEVVSDKDIIMTVPTQDVNKVKIEKEYTASLKAPIQKGDIVGKLIIKIGEDKQEFPLYSNENIQELPFFSRIYNQIKYYLLDSN
ncbi:D-alanyl-D-alanine carboxypeptidase dacA precursor [Rickettsiales bacterium Ac37b]|nr:D-alanyl-D-alanine carboxypeptidase dacA precursor [Rickettsiales bacterium Ac37b]